MLKIISHNIDAILVFVLALFLLLANIWGYPITILDEAKNAEAAREMFNGNHFLPTFNEILRTDKPPLHYFFMQLGYLVFGVNEFAARFFGGFLGAFFTAYFYFFLKKHITTQLARVAVLVLLSSFFWVQEFHLAVPDPYLLVFLCSAWLFFYNFFKGRKTKYLVLFYVFVGLATLSKGPIAIGLSGLIVLTFLIFKKEYHWKAILKHRPILGGILVLMISVPWFWWIHIKTNGAFTDGFFIQHNFERFGSEMEGHGGIFLITWAFVILGLFPFGMFVPQAIWHGWKFKRRDDLTLFSLIISVVVIVFFSISSTKLPNYTLPAIPFLAILTAGFFDEIQAYSTLKNWRNTVSLVLISVVALAIPVAVYILFQHELIQHFQIIFVSIFAISAFIGLYFIWINYLNKQLNSTLFSIAILWIVIGQLIFYLIYPNLAKVEPVMQASEIIKNQEVVVLENYDPAFNFNYKKSFKTFNDLNQLIEFLNKNPNTLVLTKNRVMDSKPIMNEKFEVIFDQPSHFENYRTIILKPK